MLKSDATRPDEWQHQICPGVQGTVGGTLERINKKIAKEGNIPALARKIIWLVKLRHSNDQLIQIK